MFKIIPDFLPIRHTVLILTDSMEICFHHFCVGWIKQKSEDVRKTGCFCIYVGIFREKLWKYPNVAWSDINWIKSPSRIPFQISFSADFCLPRITYTRWQFYFVYGVPVSTSFHRKSVPIYIASKVVHTYWNSFLEKPLLRRCEVSVPPYQMDIFRSSIK